MGVWLLFFDKVSYKKYTTEKVSLRVFFYGAF
jgi:hypothetical protein